MAPVAAMVSDHAQSQIHQSVSLQLCGHVHKTDKPKYLNSTYVSGETRLAVDNLGHCLHSKAKAYLTISNPR